MATRKKNYAEIVAPAATPQHIQAHPAQVPNSAGGWSFQVNKWTQLNRFLILGSEGGTYYIGERDLTLKNTAALQACLAENGKQTVDTVVAVSDGGRAAKNSPAIFALALACSPKYASKETVQYALSMLPKVCRTLTHLFEFVETVQHFRGWGRALRRGVGDWFADKSADTLAYQAIKYRQRDGWTGRDVLRLTHFSSFYEDKQAVLRWMVGGLDALQSRTITRRIKEGEKITQYGDVKEHLPAVIGAFDMLHTLETNVPGVVELIQKHKLPREALPTQWLNEPKVWAALLADMPYTAMLRNLATMTRVGLFDDPEHRALVCRWLADGERIRKARVHPIAILAALKTYAQGKGIKGGHSWQPVTRIIDALDAAYYLAFDNVEPHEGRVLIAIDVSGSMNSTTINGLDYLSAREGAAALALPMLHALPNAFTTGFNTGHVDLHLSARQRLDDATNAVQRLISGGTNCSTPINWALQHKHMVDTFIVLTDSESWHGSNHPFQALQKYRKRVNPAARLAVVAMCSNEYSVKAPDDAGCIDLVGFDTNTPVLLDAFVRGAL